MIYLPIRELFSIKRNSICILIESRLCYVLVSFVKGADQQGQIISFFSLKLLLFFTEQQLHPSPSVIFTS